LTDDMRLGKTLSALMMHWQWQQVHRGPKAYGPLLIAAPLKTRAVWLGWCRRIFPGIEVGVITGRTFDRETIRKPIVFGHYDVIAKWLAVFDVGTVILDEVQDLTNYKAKRTIAANTLSAGARHVVACTGTPINKYPPNLWSIVNLVAPGAWGSYYDFCQR